MLFKATCAYMVKAKAKKDLQKIKVLTKFKDTMMKVVIHKIDRL